MKILLKRLQELGLVINSGKCTFGASQINFLGYVVDSQGVRPDPGRVEAILKCPPPATVKNLRQFLGSVNFYMRFIPGAAKIQHPLNIQLCGPKKKNNRPIEWTTDLEHAFEELKNALADAAMLAHPIVGAKLSISVDASDYAIGAVLQ